MSVTFYPNNQTAPNIPGTSYGSQQTYGWYGPQPGFTGIGNPPTIPTQALPSPEPQYTQISANPYMAPYETTPGSFISIDPSTGQIVTINAQGQTVTSSNTPAGFPGIPSLAVTPQNFGIPSGVSAANYFGKTTLLSAISSVTQGIGNLLGNTTNALKSFIAPSVYAGGTFTPPNYQNTNFNPVSAYMNQLRWVSVNGVLQQVNPSSATSSFFGNVGQPSQTNAPPSPPQNFTGSQQIQEYTNQAYIPGVGIVQGTFAVGINGEPRIPGQQTTTSTTSSTTQPSVTTTTETYISTTPPTTTTAMTTSGSLTSISTTPMTTSTSSVGTATTMTTNQSTTFNTTIFPQAATTLYNSLGPSITTSSTFQALINGASNFFKSIFGGPTTPSTSAPAVTISSAPTAPNPEQIGRYLQQSAVSTTRSPVVVGTNGGGNAPSEATAAREEMYLIKYYEPPIQMINMFAQMPIVLSYVMLGNIPMANLSALSYGNLQGLESVIGTPIQPNTQTITSILSNAVGLGTVSPTTVANISAAVKTLGINPDSTLGAAAVAAGVGISGVTAGLAGAIGVAKAENIVGSYTHLDTSLTNTPSVTSSTSPTGASVSNTASGSGPQGGAGGGRGPSGSPGAGMGGTGQSSASAGAGHAHAAAVGASHSF